MDVRGKNIFVGISGGVDSAVTVSILIEAGAIVTGVFIKGWYPPGMPCTWAEDRRDAMRVAAHAGIPFHTLDASAEYKKGVIDYLLSEYKAGHTPNPDIMCNREVKFGSFYRFAKAHGADYIATGHYAQSTHNNETTLLQGVDSTKDQSYFLWSVPPEALAMSLFPLGRYTKIQVRELAQKFQVPVATKKDSQGICFLGSISVDEFLREEFGIHPGCAQDEEGTEVGTHEGVLLSTLGSRIALSDAPPGPWYVVGKDTERNILTVSHTPKALTVRTEISLREINWIGDTSGEIEAQYRYHGPRILGTLSPDKAIFIPREPVQDPIANGQSLVVYREDQCLGGGIIA